MSQKQIKSKKKNRFVQWWSDVGHWISKRSAYTKNKTINALIFALAFFIIGGTNYCWMFGIFVPTFFILDFFMIIFFISPIFFFKKTMFDRIYLPIVIVFLTAGYAMNNLFFSYFGAPFPLKDLIWALENAEQVGLHPDSLNWWIIITNILLALVFSLGIILYNALWRFEESSGELKLRRHRKVAFALTAMFGSIACFETSLQIWCAVERKHKVRDIDYVNYSPYTHFKELGLMGYYIQEVRQFMADKGESVSTIKNYLTKGTYLNDDFTGLLSNDTETNLPANVMVVMVETGDSFIYDPDTTPNLDEIFTHGIYCNQNYSYNHTNVTDAIAITGNYPQKHFDEWRQTKTPFGLPTILGNDDNNNYQTYFAHDLASANDIYHRMAGIRGLGFDECWFHKEIIPSVRPWRYDRSDFTQDSVFIDGLLKKLDASVDKTKPFYMHYLTVHMHMDQKKTKWNKDVFAAEEEAYGDTLNDPAKWVNPFKPKTSNNKRCRLFALKSMDFDTGLGMIMDKLYGSNDPYWNNTLLVVCADHSWYERTTGKHHFGQAVRHIYDNNNIKSYSSILGFYHPLLNQKFEQMYPSQNHKFNKPTWPTVVVPTILDLLGQRYNPRIYLNKSIFDGAYDNNELFYSFWNYRFMNEMFTSLDHYNITSKFGGDKILAKEFKQRLINARWQLRIIDSIYHKRLFNKYDYEDFMPPENP